MHAPNVRVDPARLRYPLLVSEKLDGFRLQVIGGTLLSKTGLEFRNRALKAHFAELIALAAEGFVFDCECWSPRLSLPEIQSIMTTRDGDIPEHLFAHVFDATTIAEWFASRVPRFERRLARLGQLLAARRPAHTSIVSHVQVTSADELLDLYHMVRHGGGEGLMVRDPAGSYRHGRCTPRTSPLFKIKPETFAA